MVAAGIIILMLGAILPSPLTNPPNAKMVSYNPFPANNFHAPLSSMGVIMASNMTGPLTISTALLSGLSSPAGSRLSGASIRQNTLRFIDDSSYFPQTETSIAVDSNNTNHVVGGFNDQKFFFCGVLPADCAGSFPATLSGFSVSADGGTSLLKSSDLPRVPAGITTLFPFGDPSVAPSTDGNFFYSSIAFDQVGHNGIIIAKSNPNLFDPNVSCVTALTNATVNSCWNAVFVFGSVSFFRPSTLEDKDLLAVDRDTASPYFGSVYIGWDHFFNTGVSQSALARCDAGLTSCVMLSSGDLPAVSGSDLFPSFTTPTVDKNGNVYVTWCNYGTFGSWGPVYCRVRSSPPGGLNFGPTSTIISYMGAGTMIPNATVTIGWATEQFRTFSLPYMVADTSAKSNNLYFTTQLCISGFYFAFPQVTNPFVTSDNPGNCGASAVLFSKSSDGGATWTTPVALSRPAVNDQPTVTVDATTGNVYVLYYTTQYDPFNHRLDVVALKSMDGGLRWRQNRVTSVSNEPNSDPNMNLYYSPNGGSVTVPQLGDYFQAVDIGGRLWVMFTADYTVEMGTFQSDPYLAAIIM